jgi:hypothetical protein
VGERRDTVDHPVDPEVAPVEQPIGQALDLVERPLQGRIAGDRRLHQVDLVEILGADGLFEDASGEHAQHTHGQGHGDPPDGRQAAQRGDHHHRRDHRQEVGDDLPPEDQDLLGVLQLVAQEQGEVEQDPGGEEVHAHQDGGRGQQVERQVGRPVSASTAA